VSNNQLTSLSVGGDLPSLDELYAAHNRLSSLEQATAFPSLDVLDVRGNALGGQAVVQPLRALTTLTALMLAGNGVVDADDLGTVLGAWGDC
jgi:Leucine-rich repeat (LRR) protein